MFLKFAQKEAENFFQIFLCKNALPKIFQSEIFKALTLSVLKKFKKLIFEIPVTSKNLNIKNYRTIIAKSIKLLNIRTLIKYSLNVVRVKTMLILTVFDIILFEGSLILGPA